MLKFELRQLFRSHGLIDDVVVFGMPDDYVHFSERVATAIVSPEPVALRTDLHGPDLVRKCQGPCRGRRGLHAGAPSGRGHEQAGVWLGTVRAEHGRPWQWWIDALPFSRAIGFGSAAPAYE